MVSGVEYYTCRTDQGDAACTRVEVGVIHERGGDPGQLKAVEGVVLRLCVSESAWYVVSCRGRGVARERKRGFSLFHLGVAARNVI